jgi:putative Mg2+ transporter-C (MgtC) family protein
MDMVMDFFLDIAHIAVALVLGMIIGLERQWRQHPAGLRTTALVCLGAALYVWLAHLVTDNSPSRIAAQVVSGVGFLGGGVILREGLNVRGLSTAATLWCSAAVGSLAGAGFPAHAVVGTFAVLGMNLMMRPVSRWIDTRVSKSVDVETHYLLRVVCHHGHEATIRTILLRHINSHAAMFVQGVSTQETDQDDRSAVVAEIFSIVRNDKALEEVVSRLTIEPGVTAVRWERGPG